jgi:hypothetical protein
MGRLAVLAQQLGATPVKKKGERMKIKTAFEAAGYTFEVEWESVDEAIPPATWFTGIIEFFEESGVKPPASAPAAAAAPQRIGGGSTGGGYNRNGSAPARRPQNAGGFACPTHGTENIGPGYNGHGQECKVWTDDPENDDPNGDWVRLDQDGNYKPSNARDGSVRYYCRHRSQSQGGGGNGGGYRRAA